GVELLGLLDLNIAASIFEAAGGMLKFKLGPQVSTVALRQAIQLLKSRWMGPKRITCETFQGIFQVTGGLIIIYAQHATALRTISSGFLSRINVAVGNTFKGIIRSCNGHHGS